MLFWPDKFDKVGATSYRQIKGKLYNDLDGGGYYMLPFKMKLPPWYGVNILQSNNCHCKTQ